MSPKRSYRSFLLRCWAAEERAPSASASERFVVESVSDMPRRWAFTSFEDMIDFLRAELLDPPADPGSEPGGPPSQEAGHG